MVAKVIDKEHIPEHTTVVAAVGEDEKGVPNGSIAKVGRKLPEDEDDEHVGGPDTDEAMEDGSSPEEEHILGLLHLWEEANGDEKASDPEESIDSKVSSRGKGGQPRSLHDLRRLHPVLDVHDGEPHPVPEHYPVDWYHPHPIQEQQVLILMRWSHLHDLPKIIIEGKAFQRPHREGVGLHQPGHDGPHHSQQQDDHQQPQHSIVGPVHGRVSFIRDVEGSPDENLVMGSGLVLIQLVEEVLHFGGELPIREFLLTFLRSTEPHVLEPHQHIDESHGNVHELVIMVEAVVVVTKVIEELPWISIRDGREFFRVLQPLIHQLVTCGAVHNY